MPPTFSRRTVLRQASALFAATQIGSLSRFALAAAAEPIVETTYGKLRGAFGRGVYRFKGIAYGGTTADKNRFMPPVKPAAWTGTRDALAFGPTAPQTIGGKGGLGPESEDCLVLNITTPSINDGAKRPVMVWLHPGGFGAGTSSISMFESTHLAVDNDVVVVTINHRLNVLGFTYLGEEAGPEFGASGCVGLMDIVASLEWVRDNIATFGGDPSLVTLFGQSGGGRKISTLMAMPSAQGLFSRAIIQSGAVIFLPTKEDANHTTDLLLAELGMKRAQVRDLQGVPISKLLAANVAAQKKLERHIPGITSNSPPVDGKVIPANPWDPAAPAISAKVPLIIGWTRTEETFFDRPTPESMALDEAGLKAKAAKLLGIDPDEVIATFRKAHPDATPWDIHILIATEYPRGVSSREIAKRKAAQGSAPAFLYRLDWETPENGGNMHAPHGLDIAFVFNNIDSENKTLAKAPGALAMARVMSAAWAAFARNGNPNSPGLPEWPAYSIEKRDTMLFNNVSRVEQDPDSGPRKIIEKVLKYS